MKKGIVYVKETSLIKVKIIKEMNGEGSPLRTVIQYWTKDGRLVAEGYADQTDEPLMDIGQQMTNFHEPGKEKKK